MSAVDIDGLPRKDVLAEMAKYDIEYDTRSSTKTLVKIYNAEILSLSRSALVKVTKGAGKKSPARVRKQTPPRKGGKAKTKSTVAVPDWITALPVKELKEKCAAHGIRAAITATTRPIMERKYAQKLAELDVAPSPQKPIKVAKVAKADPVFSDEEDEAPAPPKRPKATKKTPKKKAAAAAAAEKVTSPVADGSGIFSGDETDAAPAPGPAAEAKVETLDDTGALVCQIVLLAILAMAVSWFANEYGK